MSDFRRLSDTVFASPQITAADVGEAARQGVRAIICNRPDGEDEGQPTAEEIAGAAQEAGLPFCSVPISGAALAPERVEEMRRALDASDGPVLAYCRTGTRSTLLWALAEARAGRDPDEIAEAARQAGYDVAPVREAMERLAAQSRA